MGWVVLAVLAAVLLAFVLQRLDSRREMTLSEFYKHVQADEVVNIVRIGEHKLLGELRPGVEGVPAGEPRKFRVTGNFLADHQLHKDVRELLAAHNVDYDYDLPSWFQQIWPYILLWGGLLFMLWFLVFRRLGQAGAGGGFLGSFGRSRHRVLTKERTNVTFDDVAGIEEAKEEVQEIIAFLKDPKRFQRLGGRIPRGVLLVGEPGCGKTLLARAIAGEADVPFFSISGSDFVEMFVGVGASRVRDLFRTAKESAPCIIFLDEIDAVGRRRTHELPGGGQETSQTLNAILVEMDGFDTSDQVIVLAATNRSDVLDPALTRPGRFDRQVQVPLPDLKGRHDILKIYADKVRCGPDVDLERLARGTAMFSGADLEALVNEAAIAATMSDKETVDMADLEEARDKVRWGRARKSRVIDDREKETTAYHEAGHALVQTLLPETDPLHKVSIIPRGPYAGATMRLPEQDRYSYTRKYCQAEISVLMAGRVAEETFCGDVSSGAHNDILQATRLAKKMVLDWGMSQRLGPVSYAREEAGPFPAEFASKEYSDQTAELVDAEIKAIFDAALKRTRELIEANRDKLRRLAEALLNYETLSAEEVKTILAGGKLDRPSVTGLLKRERARTDQEPRPAAAPEPGPSPGPQTPPLPEPG